MSARRMYSLRLHDEEREAWKAAAGRAGLSLSVWVRRSANDALKLELALDQQREFEERQAARRLGQS
jgi:hypothetical protein